MKEFWLSGRLLMWLVGVGLCADGVRAGELPEIKFTEKLDFDRPESWAMKRAASLLLFTSMGPPTSRELGSVEFGLEGIWNPNLSKADQRVGFDGNKVENMNRLEIIPRPRVRIGVGWETTLDMSYIPPVEIEGIEPNIFALALERPLGEWCGWTLGARIYGQVGEVEGDITCEDGVSDIPPGSPGNEFGCEGTSSDEITVNYAGVALLGGFALPDDLGGDFHFGVYATYMDLEFQVDAVTYGERDLTRQVTDGWVYAFTAGYSRDVSEDCRLAVEVFYSPLDVDRAEDSMADADDLFNVRAMVSYRF
jgi:hypothetical protein